MTDLIPFSFENRDVRAITDEHGEPWFVAKDVALALDYAWKGPADNLGHIPDEWKGVQSVRTPGGNQQMSVLAEQGLYFFVGRSDKPKALPFQKWLAGEVLPSIRKTGSYSLKQPSYSESLRLLADEVERREHAEQALAEAAPKVAFHDQVTYNSETLIDFTQAFSLLKGRTGQNFTHKTFLEFLRRHGIACKPSIYSTMRRDSFKPRKDYVDKWFASEMTPAGTVEWKMRPLAISSIVRLIEKERTGAAMVAGYLAQGGAV